MAEMIEDILAPIVRYLRQDPVLNELHTLVPEGAVNPVLGPPMSVLAGAGGAVPYTGSSSLWIFRGFSQTGEPYAHVEGTGSCAITLEQFSPWSPKTRGKSVEFPAIKVYYHCDVSRDGVLGAPVSYDARDKLLTLHKRVSRLLHVQNNPTGDFLNWGPKADGSGALKVVTSVEGSGLSIQPIYNGDGMVEGQATYNLELLL